MAFDPLGSGGSNNPVLMTEEEAAALEAEQQRQRSVQEQRGQQQRGAPPDFRRWVCVYPAYFDGKRSAGDGRRVPMARAIDRPFAHEVLEAAARCVPPNRVLMENKTYGRDYLNRGRIRVKLFDDETHAPLIPALPNRKALFLAIGRELPNVRAEMIKAEEAARAKEGQKGKKAKAAGAIESAKDVAAAAEEAEADADKDAAGGAPAASAASARPSSSKKKGKKR